MYIKKTYFRILEIFVLPKECSKYENISIFQKRISFYATNYSVGN